MLTRVELKVSHLRNKFWTTNSIKVPNTPVLIDRFFYPLSSLWRTKQQEEFSQIWWDEFMITGQIMLPGEWNYCHVTVYKKHGDKWHLDNSKFFHLEKISTNGFLKGEEECFYYQLIYDDWQNDWLTNRVHINGSINLTGDKELVKREIHQTTPLVSNVNSFKYLKGFLGDSEQLQATVIFPRTDRANWRMINAILPKDIIEINTILHNYEYKEPEPDRLVLPLLFRLDSYGDWKFGIIRDLAEDPRQDLKVFDISFEGKKGQFRSLLENYLNTNEVYVISKYSNRSYFYAKAVNESKYIKTLDLSKCYDLIELDPETLFSKRTTKFSLENVITKLLRKTGVSESNKEWIMPMAEEILLKKIIQPLIKNIPLKDRTFQDVTLADNNAEIIYKSLGSEIHIRDNEPIIIDPSKIRPTAWGRDTPIQIGQPIEPIQEPVKTTQYLNPQWMHEIDLIPTRYYTKNGIFDETTPLSQKRFIGQFIGDVQEFKKTLNDLRMELWSKSWAYDDQGEAIFGAFPLDSKQTGDLDCVNLTLPISPLQKLVSTKGEIDHSRNVPYGTRFIALLPDYKRKCHVLAVSREHPHTYLQWPKSSSNLNSAQEVRIISFDEFTKPTSSTSFVDINAPHDLMPHYKEKFNDSEIIQRPVRFFIGTLYESINFGGKRLSWSEDPSFVLYKHYHSAGLDNDWIRERIEITNKTISYKHQTGYYKYSHNALLDNVAANDDNDMSEVMLYLSIPRTVYGANSRIIKVDELIQKYSNAPNDKLMYVIHKTKVKKGNPTNFIKIINGKPVKVNEDTIDDDIVSIWYDNRLARSPEWHGLFNDIEILIEQVFAESIPLFTTAENDYANKNYRVTRYWELFLIVPADGTYYFARTAGDYPEISNTVNVWANIDRDGWANKNGYFLISIIPNPYRDAEVQAKDPITKYYYTDVYPEDISIYNNVSEYNSAAVLALLYRLPGTWSTVDEGGYSRASQIFTDYKDHVAGKSLLLFNNYIISQIPTNRTNNPKSFPIGGTVELHGGRKLQAPLGDINDLIPPYFSRVFDPTSVLNQKLHQMTSKEITKEKFVEHFEEAVDNAILTMSEIPVWYKLAGTEWVVVVKNEFKGANLSLSYELFTTNSSNIYSREDQEWNFRNDTQDQDIDLLINSQYELNVHGTRIPLKTRYFGDDDIINMNLSINVLEDPLQTQSALWYLVQMQGYGQDTLRMVVETPKLLTKIHDMTPYERESLIREISLKSSEREAQLALFNSEKETFHNNDWLGHHSDIRKVTTGILNPIASIFNIFNPKIPTAAMKWGMGLEAGVGILDSAWNYGLTRVHRDEARRIAFNKFEVRGDLMSKNHETERQNQIMRLRRESAKITYPEMSSKLVYKILNPYLNLEDVFIVKYYPSGNLMNYITQYYREYGYEILVRDVTCTGINDIKRHIRYANVHENHHPLERIKNMIEQRALSGIYAIDWTQSSWHDGLG